eukprot:TRINITY_DN2564_c0_g1_i1.p1 TRINITY_DN2564_c0_g1~~TRINITY_DN2564_c0_g1_i1.p1  ORF type:complete len:398 (-),score=74.75 TRINITY_DN2564_c0_g1_i1:55-1248(-)
MHLSSNVKLLAALFGLWNAVAFREQLGDDRNVLMVSKPTAIGDTWICQDVSGMGGEGELEAKLFFEQRKLVDEYNHLVQSLHGAPHKWHGGYIGSELSRAMLMNGDDAAFEAKGMKLTLLRHKRHLRWSVFRLCITNAETPIPSEEVTEPFKIYRDGSKVKISCKGTYKQMQPGVVAQETPDGIRMVKLQVEVQRLLMKKTGAMALQEEFERELASGPNKKSTRGVNRHSAWATLVTEAYKERFANIGIGLFYNRAISWCCCGDKCQSSCKHKHRYYEYVDLDVKADYEPEHPYDVAALKLFVRCSSVDSEVHNLIQRFSVSLRHKRQFQPAIHACSAVESAIPRKKPDNKGDCKCPSKMQVYSGTEAVGPRKFNAADLSKYSDLYCSNIPCTSPLP